MLLLFFRVPSTAGLDGHPELDLWNYDEIMVEIRRRIEKQVHTGRYPDVVRQGNSPVCFYSVLITYRICKYFVDWVHVQKTDCRFPANLERVFVRNAGGQDVVRKAAGYTTAVGGVVRVARKADQAVPLSFARNTESPPQPC